MAVVKGYSKEIGSGLYDVKVCIDRGGITSVPNCEILNKHYMFKNEYPDKQAFPFPATEKKDIFFVPERIANDDTGKKTMLKPYMTAQSCFDIDPCDVFVSDYCCKKIDAVNSPTTTTQESKEKSTEFDDTTAVVLIVGGASLVFVVLLVLYFILRKKPNASSLYSSSYKRW